MNNDSNKPKQTRPLTEGYQKKGGQNPATSRITKRPAPPKPIHTGASSSKPPPK